MDEEVFAQAERVELIGCLLGLAKIHHDRLTEGTARLGLSLSQARVLYFVETEPMVRKLAKALSRDASYITGVVDSLEEKGLLSRQPDPDDRRIRKLFLTEEGSRLRDEVAKVISESFELDGLGPDEAEQFARLLRKLQGDIKPVAW